MALKSPRDGVKSNVRLPIKKRLIKNQRLLKLRCKIYYLQGIDLTFLVKEKQPLKARKYNFTYFY